MGVVLLAGLAAGCSGSGDALTTGATAPSVSDGRVEAYADAVRTAYSGERALDVVAFVAPKWRVPGNSGFDASILHVAALLDEAGYVEEDRAAPGQPLTYRLERRPMERPTWEPVAASVMLVGDDAPLLQYPDNRNMLAIYSASTPDGGIEAEVVDVGAGTAADFEGKDVAGKIVFGETSVRQLYAAAVQERGALGVLAYRLPSYTQPEVHRHSIQFSSIPFDPLNVDAQRWGILLSYAAKERLRAALDAGPVRARVVTEARRYQADELTLVADVHGTERPDERFVFSAHVQEPGANDNASGVGALAEIARVTAGLVQQGAVVPRRTITFLWGDEIRSTRRYLEEDPERTAGVRWGLSLDMVGEDTALTGGTFLIEKMPDPSAIWTRGADEHTEWGGRPLTEDRMTPHYFNDFALRRCQDQAAETGWVVKTNPFEGGSDHVPFLQAGKPGLLFWHFTDVYYHTDGDLIDKVSPETLRNVGVCALTTALALTTADAATAQAVAAEMEQAALDRLAAEWALSRDAVAAGADPAEQRHILAVWTNWYVQAVHAVEDVEVGGSSNATRRRIEAAAMRIEAAGRAYADRLGTP